MIYGHPRDSPESGDRRPLECDTDALLPSRRVHRSPWAIASPKTGDLARLKDLNHLAMNADCLMDVVDVVSSYDGPATLPGRRQMTAETLIANYRDDAAWASPLALISVANTSRVRARIERSSLSVLSNPARSSIAATRRSDPAPLERLAGVRAVEMSPYDGCGSRRGVARQHAREPITLVGKFPRPGLGRCLALTCVRTRLSPSASNGACC